MSRSLIAFASLLLLSSCTAITEAKKFEVDDTAFSRDFDYKFTNMLPHASVADQPGIPMELALVDEGNFAQSRARVYFPLAPANGAAYPDVELNMKNALWSGNYQMFFYIDDQPENYELDTKDAARTQVREHCWIEPVVASGVGEFEHGTQFRTFSNEDVRSLGDDVVIKTTTPDLDLLCLSRAVSAAITKSVEIRVVRIEEDGVERQMGLFKTFAGVRLPDEVKLQGIVDRGSNYTVEIVRDGESKTIVKNAVAGDIVLETKDWIDIPPSTLLGCRN